MDTVKLSGNADTASSSLFDAAVYVGFLGEGAYGVVKGYELPDGSRVAIKEVKSTENGIDSSTLIELHCMSVLKGKPCIIELLGIRTRPEHLDIMSVQHTGSMSQFIGLINFNERLSVFPSVYEQLLEGLLYINNAGIIHRDIKPDNILMEFFFESLEGKFKEGITALANEVTLVGPVKCYYADFGIAFQTNCKNSSEIDAMTEEKSYNVYTPGYRAPEILKKEPYSSRADVWALGITIVQYLIEDFSVYPTKEQLDLEEEGEAVAGTRSSSEELSPSVIASMELDNIMKLGNKKGEYINLKKLGLDAVLDEMYVEEIEAMLCFDPYVRNRITDFREVPSSIPRTVYQPKRGKPKSNISIKEFTNLVIWILDTVSQIEGDYRLAVNSIDLLERYLTNYETSVETDELDVIVIACIAISSKMSDTIIVDLDSFSDFSKDILIETEYDVLKKMNYICTSCELGEYLVVAQSLKKPLRSLKAMYKRFGSSKVYSGTLSYQRLSKEVVR